MSLFVRYLKRALVMLALLAAVVIVAGAIYVRTASFGRLLKGQARRSNAERDRYLHLGRAYNSRVEHQIWRRASRPDSTNPPRLFVNSVAVARSANRNHRRRSRD